MSGVGGSVPRFLPLLDRVLVRRLIPQTKTAGGVLLPEASQSKLNQGVVVRVGGGARDREGKVIAPSVKEGDKVVLPDYGGSTLKLDNEEFQLYREQDLLGVLH
jgi:chaperonin GroES